MMPLQFRNVDADPSEPVEAWPQEAVVAALERGYLPAWQRVAAAIEAEPDGRVASGVEEWLSYTEPRGVAVLMRLVLDHARRADRTA